MNPLLFHTCFASRSLHTTISPFREFAFGIKNPAADPA
jgi:hypothetical protein